MTAKEKAQQLVDNYYVVCQEFTEEIQCSIQAKQCALIAVDEIIELISGTDPHWINELMDCWEQVKQEMNNL